MGVGCQRVRVRSVCFILKVGSQKGSKQVGPGRYLSKMRPGEGSGLYHSSTKAW